MSQGTPFHLVMSGVGSVARVLMLNWALILVMLGVAIVGFTGIALAAGIAKAMLGRRV
ncbi:MAG: hypothetical protein M3O20_07040 [Acidobacteriota bacterium]|nr:hypothetical protein [Acidobacteriota bacterium]